MNFATKLYVSVNEKNEAVCQFFFQDCSLLFPQYHVFWPLSCKQSVKSFSFQILEEIELLVKYLDRYIR